MAIIENTPPYFVDPAETVTQHWEQRDADRLYLRKPRSLVPLAIVFVLLNAGDWLTTSLVLRSGTGAEANPIAQLFVGSTLAFLAVKFIYAPSLAWRIAVNHERHPWERLPVVGLWMWTIMFTFVVFWNLRVVLA